MKFEPQASADSPSRCRPPNETSIKAAVLSKLIRQRRISSSSVLASEFAIHGTRTRADLAVLGRQLLGIEIKSAADSLRRLPIQLANYQKVFDRVLLVLAQRHLLSFDKLGYPWLEIWVVDDLLRISVVQKPNASCRSASVRDYKSFLTVEDAKLSTKGLALKNPKARFVGAFKEKFQKTSECFWQSLSDDSVVVENIKELSRFRERRERDVRYRAAREAHWEDWLINVRKLSRGDYNQSFQSSSVEYSIVGSP